MLEFSFFVPGTPEGKERPRKGKNGNVYTPKKTKEYETLIMQCAQTCADREKLMPDWEGPVILMITANFAIPKSTTEKERNLIASGFTRPTKKPDGDNIAKAVLDALNGVAYVDDKQVTYLKVVKRYVKDQGMVGLEILVDYGNRLAE